MKLTLIIPFILAGLLHAQAPADDPFRGLLFPPELVMQNQQLLELTDDQRTYLRDEVRKTQAAFTDMQWKLQDEMGKLIGLMRQPAIDEPAALAQFEKVLAAEREMKKAQVTLLLRVRNHLKPDQQAKLRELQVRPKE